MANTQSAIFDRLEIGQDLFNKIIQETGARQEIAECLVLCLEKGGELAITANALLLYMAAANRTDADSDDIDWITINGTHVPLDDKGNAVGGGNLKGQSFSNAKSEKKAAQSKETSNNSTSRTAWKEKNETARAAHKALESSDKAVKLVRLYGAEHGDPLYDRILDAFKEGNIDEEIDRWYDIMEANGDTTPTKATVDSQKDLYDVVQSEYDGDWEEARIGTIMKDTGMSREEAEKAHEELQTWMSSAWNMADTKTLDSYIEKAPAYDGTIYRGLLFTGEGYDDYGQFMESIKSGIVRMNGNSSWSSDLETARRFAHPDWDDTDSVVIKCVGNKTATPIDHLSSANGGEEEVLAHSRTAWTVLNVIETEKADGGRHAEITVIERGEYEDA